MSGFHEGRPENAPKPGIRPNRDKAGQLPGLDLSGLPGRQAVSVPCTICPGPDLYVAGSGGTQPKAAIDRDHLPIKFNFRLHTQDSAVQTGNAACGAANKALIGSRRRSLAS